MDRGSELRREVLRWYADECINSLRGDFRTATDVGIYSEDLLVMAERSDFICSLPLQHGGSGDSALMTGYGLLCAMKAFCQSAYGSDFLKNKKIVVSGVGKVGWETVRRLVKEGAEIVVADIEVIPKPYPRLIQKV